MASASSKTTRSADLGRVPLIVVDEVGYTAFEAKAANPFLAQAFMGFEPN
jgi:hypothetical protein